jgi:hypothetical protein
MMPKLVAALVVALALADAGLHLSLDFLFFSGNFFANELSRLFFLNFVGYIVLTVAFILRRRLLGSRAWLTDAALVAFALGSIGMWLSRNAPNPQGLGYPSKAMEVLLILAASAHLLMTRGSEDGELADQGG